jgi:hypothetical protein
MTKDTENIEDEITHYRFLSERNHVKTIIDHLDFINGDLRSVIIAINDSLKLFSAQTTIAEELITAKRKVKDLQINLQECKDAVYALNLELLKIATKEVVRVSELINKERKKVQFYTT